MARVLLVEDDDAIRTSLGKSLTAAGHVVTAVAAGADGVAAVARGRPRSARRTAAGSRPA